jgi:hypothetical protein
MKNTCSSKIINTNTCGQHFRCVLFIPGLSSDVVRTSDHVALYGRTRDE